MISAEELVTIVKGRGTEEGSLLLSAQGGIEGCLSRLASSRNEGVQSTSVAERRELYGRNEMKIHANPSYFRLLLDACSDVTILILVGAAVISLIVAMAYEPTLTNLAESIAILVSIVVVTNVAAFNDWNKQRHFARLYAEASRVIVRVIRDGCKLEIDSKDVVVGDVVSLNVGEIVCADGLFLNGDHISMDESALTGEPKLVHKQADRDIFILSGTKVMEGEGSFLVTAVGGKSEAGEIQKLVRETETGKSVLSAKLDRVVILTGKLGLLAASLCFAIMLVRFVFMTFVLTNSTATCGYLRNIKSCAESGYPTCSVQSSGLQAVKQPTTCCESQMDRFRLVGTPCGWQASHFGDILHFFITAITILVVAVPEGLPLAVTLALAFAGRRMQKEQNLVKHLDACETMGSATTICSDKTGTLTKNRMTVVRSLIASCTDPSSLRSIVSELVAKSISLNSTADVRWNDETNLYDQIGNKTDCALLGFVIDELGIHYATLRADPQKQIIQTIPFSSEKKFSASVVQWSESERHLYVKGASEILIERCEFEVTADGNCSPLTTAKREILKDRIQGMAKQALRTIVVAMRKLGASAEVGEDDICDLMLLGIFGIEDPLRAQVPQAIRQCRRAGIDVRMVTGDNIDTAVAIARKCNILRSEDLDSDREPLSNRALTGPEFRLKVLDQNGELDQQKFDEVWPHLRVLARSSPADKYTLVSGLMSSELYQTEAGKTLGLYPDRQVVAVTGDGTNDAPALKKADVGLAMGITGTQVSKDAADIILMDDNFTSIVTACKWGRNVYDAIAKFLQFQLTVNVVAISLAIIGSIAYSESPLRAVQMLWVNLIMDSIASLALATEPPTEALLNRPPYGRNRSIISPAMTWNILGHSLYQLTVLLILLFAGPSMGLTDGRGLDHKAPPTVHYTLIFNCFVFMQLGNQINSRKLYHEWNMFDGILANRMFIFIEALELVFQILLVQFGGVWFRTAPLELHHWLISVATGVGSFLVQLCIVTIARTCTPYTTKPWLKEGLCVREADKEVHGNLSGLAQMSSKILSGILGDIPDENELRHSAELVGFRRNRTREIRDARLYQK